MKLGVLPPYVGSSVVEPDWVRSYCLAMEDEGVESVWTVEHVVVPSAYTSTYPYHKTGRMPLRDGDPIPDPLEWVAFGAGVTTRLVFGTAVLILPEHNPVHLAKRLATIQALSGGRLLAGIGVGWLKEEFDAIGVPFDHRGARADEYIAVMRALWTGEPVSFDGAFVRFEAVTSRPHRSVPIIVGGDSPAAARRAGRLGDGFYPFAVDLDTLADRLRIMRTAAEAAGRDPASIEITASSPRDVDIARRLADMGITRFVLPTRAEAPRESVARYRARVLDPLEAG